MASLIEPASQLPSAELAELGDLCSDALAPLLEEEIGAWRERFDWDFRPSADLVCRFIDQRALGGFAFVERGLAVAYCYYVHDEHKGLVGDLYVAESRLGRDYEHQLLDSTVGALMRIPPVTRIETQLVLMAALADWTPSGLRGRRLPAPEYLSLNERQFMRLDLRSAPAIRPVSMGRRVAVEPWSERFHEGVAHLIPQAYAGHVDSDINDQYRSVAGARRFLHNIVQYPGCGAFFRSGSFVALDRDTGGVCGVSLASLVAPDAGHVTQICVVPERQGSGLGRELLRRSLAALAEAGCRRASLTVTSSNRPAIGLYERAGFRVVQRFYAFTWEGF